MDTETPNDAALLRTLVSDLHTRMGHIEAQLNGIEERQFHVLAAAQNRAGDLGKMVELLGSITDEVGPTLRALQENAMFKMMFGKGK